MKKTILTFGLLSGVASSLLMIAYAPFMEKVGQAYGYLIGYTMVVLSMLLVYFGIRSYRDNLSGGQITFFKGFAIGISISLFSCIFYVITWQIIYFNFMHNSMDQYFAQAIAKAQASGSSPAAIQAQIDQISKMRANYNNPLYNAAITFIEPFPVGLVITLISAAILRRKKKVEPLQSPLPA